MGFYCSKRCVVAERLEDPQRYGIDLTLGFLRVASSGRDDLGARPADARRARLGLAMAKRIVDAHGGEIFCRSAVNQGTVFYLAIPAAPASGA